ncbi:MAG: sterol desaturase family protein [Cyanobacteria bacterium SZAS LIN-3]|nr:sterol desaturase family protein [Cyanobacteria bacterium SZAS LIN-3]MBS2009103.1 sterol desaturase family protein [Cyanobacteria bacterium SZAS TMP-1]
MFEVNQVMAGNFLIFAVSMVVLEAIMAARSGRKLYDFKDSGCNLFILLVARLSQPLFMGYIAFTLLALERLVPWHLPPNIATTAAALLLTDFVYYWQHRLSHTNRWLWFLHEVHHSSKYFNLSTSFRLHWLNRAIAPLFFAPLILLGFGAEQVTIFFLLNLFYQFVLHTRMVGKIPLLEGIFNTPSAHRVHHARNKQYLNKNFGGILMLWDRLFGTYQAEEEEPKFGIIGTFESTNPFTVQFHKLPGYSLVARRLTSFFAAVILCATSLEAARAEEVFDTPKTESQPATSSLQGKVEVSVSPSPILGLWKAHIKRFGRHPQINIERVDGEFFVGTYTGLLGKFPLRGRYLEDLGMIQASVDFSSAKLLRWRRRPAQSLIAQMQGVLKDGQLTGTAVMPDLSTAVVQWDARKVHLVK